jgi:hypothetical protein
MVLGQPLPVSPGVAEGLARHWAEVTALALVGADGLRDRDFTASVVWPTVRGVVLDSALARRLGPTPPPDRAAVDSAFTVGRLRLLARVLRRASPEAHPEERRRQREAAFEIHEALVRGGSWNEAVARSEDEATRPTGGLLGVVGPGELEPALERAAFSLDPGAISAVLETPEGYQILFRPRLDDVRPLFREGLQDRRQARRRAALIDSVVTARAPGQGADAGPRLIALARGNAVPDGRGSPLARWDGGALSDTAAARYLATLSREDRDELLVTSGAAAAELVLEIAGQEVLWTSLAPLDDPVVQGWESAAAEAATADWLATVDSVTRALDLTGAGGDSGTRARRIEEYMEAVVSRRRTPLRLSPAVIGHATTSHELRVDTAGIRIAVDRASRLLASAGVGS